MKNLNLDNWLPKNHPEAHAHWLREKKEHARLKRILWYKENKSTGRPSGRPRKKPSV